MPLISFIVIIAVGTFCVFIGSFLIKSILDMRGATPEQLCELKQLAKYSDTVAQMINDYGHKGYISRGDYNEVVYFYDSYVSRD